MAVVMATFSHPPLPSPSLPPSSPFFSSPLLSYPLPSFSFAPKSIQMHLNATVGTVKATVRVEGYKRKNIT